MGIASLFKNGKFRKFTGSDPKVKAAFAHTGAKRKGISTDTKITVGTGAGIGGYFAYRAKKKEKEHNKAIAAYAKKQGISMETAQKRIEAAKNRNKMPKDYRTNLKYAKMRNFIADVQK